MAFDSVVMAAVVAELKARIVGGRISKIYQPTGDEVALLIYANGSNYRLLLTANARFARLHLTAAEKKNPPHPPTFCMLLRKYIEGGRIVGIEQVGRERVCRIRIAVTDELGNPVEFVLLSEVMGKHSNLLLLNPSGKIVDAIRRVTEEVNRYRELLPGLPYIAPPPLQKLSPDGLTGDALIAFAPVDPQQPLWQFLLDRVDGLGPLLAKEAGVRAGFGAEDPVDALLMGASSMGALLTAIDSVANPAALAPHLYKEGSGRLKEFHVLPLQSWTGPIEGPFAGSSALLDAYFARKEGEDVFRALHGTLRKLIKEEIGRVGKKHHLQQESLNKAESAEALRLQGELITANLWSIQKGQTAVSVVNWYDPDGAELTIELDPALSPSENAQDYYHRYQKARAGLVMIQEQLAKSGAELAYLEQVDVTLAEAESMPDLEEIRRELEAEGYLGAKTTKKGALVKGKAGKANKAGKEATAPKQEPPAAPLTIQSTDGFEIWVGRNNRQNDMLTMRLAAQTDLWFHTKEIAGAHVILRIPPGAEVPERAIHEAAALAAYHSKGRESSSVPVDYAVRKHVRKPSGARPGMVIYDHNKTLWVTPDPALHPILQREATHDGTREAGPGTDDGAS
ncbi:MAG TPA: NFACT RNA binding domain-containing protein [Symbiobacteriaceae bacterium]|nr:NFACT RNA binding domain-containing protein [Symbiobacteriaceae bacterium]